MKTKEDLEKRNRTRRYAAICSSCRFDLALALLSGRTNRGFRQNLIALTWGGEGRVRIETFEPTQA